MLTLLRFVKYIPVLIGLIKPTIEMVEATKAGLPGPEKKKAVLDAIESAWPALAAFLGLTAPISGVLAVAGILVDLCVGIYNAIGVFAKKPPVVTAVPPAPASEAPAPAGLSEAEMMA